MLPYASQTMPVKSVEHKITVKKIPKGRIPRSSCRNLWTGVSICCDDKGDGVESGKQALAVATVWTGVASEDVEGAAVIASGDMLAVWFEAFA